MDAGSAIDEETVPDTPDSELVTTGRQCFLRESIQDTPDSELVAWKKTDTESHWSGDTSFRVSFRQTIAMLVKNSGETHLIPS